MVNRSPESLDSAIREAVDGYVSRSLPAEEFSRVRPFARECASRLDLRTPSAARAAMAVLCDVTAWSLSVGVPLEVHAIFDHRNVERYIEVGLANASAAKRRTYRPKLRRYAGQLAPKLQPPAPARQSRPRSKDPYTRVEVEEFLRLAEHQKTRTQSRRLQSFFCLGFGAGLTLGEYTDIADEHVYMRDGTVFVAVQGRNPRTVPVLRPFAKRLFLLSIRITDDYLLGGSDDAPRTKRVETLLKSVRGGHHLPPIEIGRMRATWLTHHLHTIGFDALLAGAGIESSSTLFDLVRAMPRPDDAQIAETLRGSW